jgi:hypothetical protein
MLDDFYKELEQRGRKFVRALLLLDQHLQVFRFLAKLRWIPYIIKTIVSSSNAPAVQKGEGELHRHSAAQHVGALRRVPQANDKNPEIHLRD